MPPNNIFYKVKHNIFPTIDKQRKASKALSLGLARDIFTRLL